MHAKEAVSFTHIIKSSKYYLKSQTYIFEMPTSLQMSWINVLHTRAQHSHFENDVSHAKNSQTVTPQMFWQYIHYLKSRGFDNISITPNAFDGSGSVSRAIMDSISQTVASQMFWIYP